jgi:hypothetical protein
MDLPRCFCRKMRCPKNGEQQGGLPGCPTASSAPVRCGVDAALSSPAAGSGHILLQSRVGLRVSFSM